MNENALCQARIRVQRADGTDRCVRKAAHEHYALETGKRLHLCTQHLRCVEHRERLGSSRDLVEAWLQGPIL